MSLELEKIHHELEEALATVAESKGEGLVRQIRPILFANLDRGRVQHFVDGRSELICTYVGCVVDGFVALNGYLHKLQIERSTEVWEPLFERMQKWAYNFFLRKRFAADGNTQGMAIECATEAALTLLDARFPYDTDFDPWAHIIVQNACRKFMQRAMKKSVVPEDKKVELEDSLISSEDLLLEIQTLQKELRSQLSNALGQLSEARRTVIQLIYFDEMEAAEVAQKMGKSVSAVYSLQFNALHDLRKILSTFRDNISE